MQVLREEGVGLREEDLERRRTEARATLNDVNHFERRADDERIAKLEEFADDQRTIWYGSGIEQPGVLEMIRSIHRTLKGTDSEPGLIQRVTVLEEDKATRARNMGIASGIGAVFVFVGQWVWKQVLGGDK